MWGCSSDGRARRSQRRGQGFDSPHLHHPTEIIEFITVFGLWFTPLVHKRVPERRPKVAKGKKFTSPSYLQSTPHGYYFRYKVPPDVRPVIGRTELESSLRTGKLSEIKEQSAKSDYHDVS